MSLYLIRFSYTPEAWAQLIKNPADRRDAVDALAGSVGGRLVGMWFSFGAHDGYELIEAPDNVSAAAVSVVAASTGLVSSVQTDVLLSVEEMLEALTKAGAADWVPPGS